MRSLLALTVLLALPAVAGAAGHSRATCSPPHTKTLVADAHIRVYSTRHVVEHAHVTYGCLLSRRHPRRFYLPDFPLGFGPIVLAAPYVAYGDYSDCAASFCNPNSIVLQDLRTGKVRFVNAPTSVADVFGLVLRPNGSLAWIASAYDQNGVVKPGFVVAEVLHGHAPVVLDASTTVDRGSLALGGSTLYWTDAGVAHSAPLP